MRKFSIFSWFGYPMPIEERFRIIKATGFDGVMLWWGYEEMDGDMRLQPEMARREGLFVENIHTPFLGVNHLWSESCDGDAYESILASCIRDCSVYGIPTAVVHISQSDAPPPPNRLGLDRIKRLVEIAERKNVNIALENLRRLEHLEYVLSDIQSPRLGFCYDSGHENCYAKGADLLAQYGFRLMALHLHDNDGSSDQHLVPGEGAIDWTAVGRKLKEVGYEGAIALEAIKPESDGRSAEEFLKSALMAAKDIFKY